MANETSALRRFTELLEQLPPSDQEEVLYRTADRCREVLKRLLRQNTRAPEGKFRVVGVDSDDEFWCVGDYDTIEIAREHLRERRNRAPTLTELRICDDAGNTIDEDSPT